MSEILAVRETEVLVIESGGEMQVVEVADQGPAGPPGPAGAPGAQGDPGLSGSNYVHQQMTPSDTWVVAHGLNRFPSVTVVDSGGSVVIGSVSYDSSHQITITFTAAFGGNAYLN